MSGIINTGTLPKALWPGIKKWFGQDYAEIPAEWPDLFDQETSDKAYEDAVKSTGFGLAPVKPQGEGIQYDSQTQDYTARATHVVYGMGYVVTEEEEDDNQYEKVARRRTRGLAFSMRQTKENVLANVYNRAFNVAYPMGDAAAIISASHPTLAGNQSNLIAVAADFSETALEDLCIQIDGAVDSRGLKIGLSAKVGIFPRQLRFEAARVLKSTLQNNTANNAINALKAENALPGGYKINHYLTDADAWFIRTNSPDGMTFYSRKGLTFQEDNDFDTKNHKYAATERYSALCIDWQGLYGSPGA